MLRVVAIKGVYYSAGFVALAFVSFFKYITSAFGIQLYHKVVGIAGTDKKFAYIHSCYVFSFDTMDNGDFLILLPTVTDYVSTIFCGIPASECEKTQSVQMFLSKQKDSAPNIEFKNFYMPKNSLYRGIC